MANDLLPNEDQCETHRALVKLLQYVEDECTRIGYPIASWMVAMSRNTLETELTDQPSLYFDNTGHPRLN